MSPSDMYRLKDAENNLAELNRQIPGYIRDDMTREEMQAAVIANMKANPGDIRLGGSTIKMTDIDGRFADAKNARYQGLIDGLNATNLRDNSSVRIDRDGSGYFSDTDTAQSYFRGRVGELTRNYSTKELREFVTSELGARIYRGGRSEYEGTIRSALRDRFIDEGMGSSFTKRSSLSEVSTTVPKAVSHLHQMTSNRSVYKDRIAEIQEKYSSSKR